MSWYTKNVEQLNAINQTEPRHFVACILKRYDGLAVAPIKAAIQVADSDPSRAANLIKSLESFTADGHPNIKNMGGYLFLLKETIANLTAQYYFLSPEPKPSIDGVSNIGKMANISNGRTGPNRIIELIQSGEAEYLSYVSSVDEEFANPITFLRYYKYLLYKPNLVTQCLSS